MLSSGDREQFATNVIAEVRRWPGVELRPHASPTSAVEPDGIEFLLYGRQIGHVHGDCSVHLALTKALKATVVDDQLAQPLDFAPTSGWAMFNPTTADDAQRAIWLLRLNYVRLRRQRLTPLAASSSEVLRAHEAALAAISPAAVKLVQRTQARMRPRPLPPLDAQRPTGRAGGAQHDGHATDEELSDSSPAGRPAVTSPQTVDATSSSTPIARTARAIPWS